MNFPEGRPAAHFDTFPIALLTVFQVKYFDTIPVNYIVVQVKFCDTFGQFKPKTMKLALRGKSKDGLAQNQDNVSEWSDIPTKELLFQ